MKTMSQELWATYSVKDHLTPRSLAIDIMLYDRLVFPVPQKAEFKQGPDKLSIEWVKDPAEWERWEKEEDWQPERQQKLLEVLNPVVRKMSWGFGGYEKKYGMEAAKLAAQGVPDYAFQATRTVLAMDLPSYVTGVAAVGPAYRTVQDMERELAIKEVGERSRLPAAALATVLAWKFVAPDLSNNQLSDEELLRETVQFVSGNDEFRKRRTAFAEWQQRFLRGGQTDPESIARAIEEMQDLLDAAEQAATKLSVRKVARYAFRIAPAALGLGLAVAGVPGGVEAAEAGLFISVGGIAVDEAVFKEAERGGPAPTAFVHDVRRHFGWK
jgi:hypothetical protein